MYLRGTCLPYYHNIIYFFFFDNNKYQENCMALSKILLGIIQNEKKNGKLRTIKLEICN